MIDWRPIETAEKYSGDVLLWFPEFPGFLAQAWPGVWREDILGWAIQTPVRAPDGRAILISHLPVEPTHWAPRPEEPGSPVTHVRIPTDANEAALMCLLGRQYLEKHAPERLKK